jgi:hypothetical protein
MRAIGVNDQEAAMDFVARLLLREEIDALDHDLAEARQAETVDVKRIGELEAEIERLEDRFAAARRAEIERRLAG